MFRWLRITDSRAFRDSCAAFVFYFSTLLNGIDFSFSAFFLLGRDNMTLKQEALLGSVNVYARIIGSFFTVLLIDRLGRKFTLQLALILHILGWWSIAHSTSYNMMYFGRVLTGIAGGTQKLSDIYLSEVCLKDRIGRMVAARCVFISLGSCFCMAGVYLYDWKAVANFSLCFAVVGLIQVIYIPESKYWYMLKNQREKAKESLLWFWKSATPEDVDNDLGEVTSTFRSNRINKSSCWTIFLEPENLKSFIVAVLLFVLQAGGGRAPIQTHAEHFFAAFHMKFDSGKMVLFLGLSDFIASSVFVMLADACDRKKLAYTPLAIMIFTLVGIFINDFVFQTFDGIPSSSITTIVLIYIYVTVCLTGASASINVITAEMIQHEDRGVILSAIGGIAEIARATYAYTMPYVLESTDVHFILLFFLCNAFAGIAIIWFFVPETRGTENTYRLVDLADDDQSPLDE